jgi:glutamate-1-semialdehyde 2,1-aminomutase
MLNKTLPKSASLYSRARQVMPGGNTRHTVFRTPHQVYAARGEGCRIWDVDGNVRIDAIQNFTALIHGYGNAHVLEAARRQLELGLCFGMPTEGEIKLSEMLVERLPGVKP